MSKNTGIQTLIITTTFLLLTSPPTHHHSSHAYTSSTPLANRIGVTIQDFVTISSSFSSSPSQTSFQGGNKPSHKIVELKLSWALLLPDVATQIRHNCGKNLFNGMIKSSYNKGKDYTKSSSSQADLLKSVNCSFTKDHAVLTLVHDSHSDFAVSLTRRIIALKLSPFQGEDSNEVCSLKLRGYEKFGVIFVAYKKTGGGGDALTIVKFPKGFVKFVDVVGLEKRGSSVSIFDPKAGKGKTFLKSKDCIRVLLRLRRDEDQDYDHDMDLDVIENFCIIECQDVSPGADKRVGKVQKIRNKTKTNTHRKKTEL